MATKTQLWVRKPQVNAKRRRKAGQGDCLNEPVGDGVWIYNPENGPIDNPNNTCWEQTPYNLEAGDVITCYDPEGDEDDPPVVEEFEVVLSEGQGPPPGEAEPIVTYDTESEEEDSLEVDLSALEGFEENYDPGAGGPLNEDNPYIIETLLPGTTEPEDQNVSIGING